MEERAKDPAKAAPTGQAVDDLAVRIRSLIPALSPAEQRVGEAVVADPAGTAARTITELAGVAKTSETTVIRFCKALALGGYPELRLRLAAESARNSASDGARSVGGDIGPSDSMAEIVEKVTYADARTIEDTGRQLDTELLQRVADLLARARRIDLFGVGASAFVAADFQQKLHRIGATAFAWSDTHVALASAALLGPGDLVVGISHTGETVDTVDVLREARRHGATAVALTNFPRSTVATTAEYVLTTAARETTFRSGATVSRIAQLTVVDCLFSGIAQRQYDETLAALDVTFDAVRDRRPADRSRR